jgi:transcriptional regulator with XRE-family HTH domain
MKFAEAFKLTLFHFNLSGIEIAEKSRLSAAQISSFRHGKNLRIDSVERILDALPLEARVYLLNLVAQAANESVPSLVEEYELAQEETPER